MLNQIKNLILPPKCVICGNLLGCEINKPFNEVICPVCSSKIERAKLDFCHGCNVEMIDCRCIPEVMKSAGCDDFVKLFVYDRDANSPVNRMIFRLKKQNLRKLFEYSAKQLYNRLSIRLEQDEIVAKTAVFTYMPRTNVNVSVYGYDHAKRLSKDIAELCGGDFSSLIKRARGSKEQKELSAGERVKNVKGKFKIHRKANITNINGRDIIIVDDVVTTGSSMSECVKILKGAGAKSIICVSLAVTE